MREEKVAIKGLNSFFRIKGEGKPLLILHGWNGSSDSWSEVQNTVSLQAYKVICFDFPGFRESEMPKTDWHLDDYMEWLKELIDYLKLDKFYLLGHSFGGRVAVKFINKYPAKVEKLILCDPAGVKMKLGLRNATIKFMAETGNTIFKKVKPVNDFLRSIFYFFLKNKDYVKAGEKMRKTLINVLEEDLADILPNIDTETLIIWGENDKMVPVKYAYVFNEKIKNSKLEILKKIGHSPHLESPQELSQLIIKFLK